ncbi:hypothetical protein N7510_005619 [Penicillium lagena]|uniref:uncharacterized protein n=1 Tax=Penicillium lagena TaxID=94218 RepID=UPI002540D6FA|nr:uncharacterized protein N7510_005619 [Penicillium lagena]KAJ5612425.1 hypothetical protein N7510_005619 [Penicillium lagena]
MDKDEHLVHGLEACDWEQLQHRYTDAMDEYGRMEENLRAEAATLLEIFTAWSQTTVLQDENRAFKRFDYLHFPFLETNLTSGRFKTQMQHVQHSEVNVEHKKQHCQDMEVVKAFESALKLLNEQLKG